jgi:cation transport regulator ChaC
VERCLDERPGRMLHMKSPCIILDDLVCEGVYNANCPREFVPFWREIWLERVEERP